MVIDSGCSRTLVHEKFVSKDTYTGEVITIFIANGDRVEVPLAWVNICSKQGLNKELVAVMKNLPVDCLLGRSSYGKSLAKENLLDHWEQAVDSEVEPSELSKKVDKPALVVTRRQAALVKTQSRLDKLIDERNELAIKTLSPKEPKKNEYSEFIELDNLFGEENPQRDSEAGKLGKKEKVSDHSFENVDPVQPNILDRSHQQLVDDQKTDVTLRNLTILNSPPEDTDGYFYMNGTLLHRKFTKHPHNGSAYIDRVVAPEVYRPEILRLGHSIPLAGHMGQEKTYERISWHFFWPHLYKEVKDYCATCPECQLISRKTVTSRAPST